MSAFHVELLTNLSVFDQRAMTGGSEFAVRDTFSLYKQQLHLRVETELICLHYRACKGVNVTPQ
jgi:hypothetical protein